jgi:hypothetical protein
MPNPGSQPANKLVIRFVKAMLIFASHRFRNRIIKTPEAAMAMIMMAKMAPALTSLFVLRALAKTYAPTAEAR